MAFNFRRKALITVSWDAWPGWLPLVGIVVAIGLSLAISSNGSDPIRYAGTILQELGLVTVAIGFTHRWKLFKQPSVLENTRVWFGQLAAAFISRKKPLTTQPMASNLNMAADIARVVITEPNASLDRRVTLLEEQLNGLRDETKKAENAIRSEFIATIEQEQRKRETEGAEISRQIKKVAVGDLNLEFVGLVWLALGVFGASIPEGFAQTLSLSLAAVLDTALRELARLQEIRILQLP